MIETVRIENLGVIERAELSLGTGLTALTGETGAGKTMAVTSLQLLLGARADARKVRHGADSAYVEGEFLVPADSPILDRIDDAGGVYEQDGDDAVVIISRTIPARGRSRSFIGGHSVPTTILAEIAQELVSIHGQSDQLRLATPSHQRQALDTFGGDEIAGLRAQWKASWEAEMTARRELDEWVHRSQEAGKERLALEALVEKVSRVDPQEGEEAALRSEAHRLENTDELYRGVSNAATLLAGSESRDDSVLSLLVAARASLDSLDDPEIDALVERLVSAEAELSDISASLADVAAHTEADPERLSEIYERRQQLSGLRKSLGMDLDQALKESAQAAQTLATLGDPEVRRTQLEENLAAAHEESLNSATRLTDARRRAAADLAALVSGELPDLALPDATFTITIEPTGASASGMDQVVFLLASHSGAPEAPLAVSASGGELSRVMLAVEVALASRHHDSVHTFLFDEVDAGVGGRAALSIGRRLAALGEAHQVLVVTHLAQVAAYASHQAVVTKFSDMDETRTEVVDVSGEERLGELARMLSGSDTPTARAHAAELLSETNMAR